FDLTERIKTLMRAAIARQVPDNITALLVTDLTSPDQKIAAAALENKKVSDDQSKNSHTQAGGED
ncbi:hypothetical protein, partial [Fructobacillus ficulneus]